MYNLKEIPNKDLFLSKKNGREIFIYNLKDSVVCNDSLFYPNIRLYSHENSKAYNPINEGIMSLGDNLKDEDIKIADKYDKHEEVPLFFFCYNIDNYFHFVYDTLPYLISFLHLKKTIPNLKLLMAETSFGIKKHYKFVTEFLELLDITKDDIVFLNNETLYKNIFISSSYTHDNMSDEKPRDEIYDLYDMLIDKCKDVKVDLHKKIYISRRTWIHNDTSNLGTNYTTRRKLVNEDDLVKELNDRGFKEIFAENLSVKEKIKLFSNADHIIGAIGGGICNALFCKNNCDLSVIISPTFMEKHKRFNYSFTKTNTSFFTDTKHVDIGHWKKYMRVKSSCHNVVGEIIDFYNDSLLISYVDSPVAGWNNKMKTNSIYIHKEECQRLDNGLNCEWSLNINKFLNTI